MGHDLSTGAAKLSVALQALQVAWRDTSTYWNDETSQAYERNYLEPLARDIRMTWDSTEKITELFARAERECS